LTVGNAALQAEPEHEIAAQALKIIAKIFWSVTASPSRGVAPTLPRAMLAEDQIAGWVKFLLSVVRRPIPPSKIPKPDEEGEQMACAGSSLEGVEEEQERLAPFWKAKKWAVRTWMRLLVRYGESWSQQRDDAEETKLRKILLAEYLPGVLQAILMALQQRFQGGFIPNKVHSELLEFVSDSVSVRKCWEVLKPELKPLFYHVILPGLWFDAHDQALWEDEPVEYIVRKYGEQDELQSPRNAASQLLCEIARHRGKSLGTILTFCGTSLSAYKDAVPGEQNHCMKEGVLYALGSIRGVVRSNKKQSNKVMDLLERYAIPDFDSEIPHLRACACWVATHCKKQWMRDDSLRPLVLQKVMNCVNDRELPVAYQACQALRFLSTASGKTRQLIIPVLPNLIDSVMHVMEMVGNGETFAALEELITRFPEEVAPHGARIGGSLCTKVTELISRYTTHPGESEAAALALSAAFPALIEILQALRESPQVFEALEGPLITLLQRVLSGLQDGGTMDYLNDALEAFNFLTYCTPTISDPMWALFRPICQAWDQHGSAELVLDSLPSVVDNFIRRGNQRFLNDPANPQAVYKMAWKMVEKGGDIGDNEILRGVKLAAILLLNCRGGVDGYIPLILNELILPRSRTSRIESERVHAALIRLGTFCLWYNPQLTIDALVKDPKNSYMETFFADIFLAYLNVASTPASVYAESPERARVGKTERAAAVEGLSEVLTLPSLPPNFPLHQLLVTLAQLLRSVEEQDRLADTGRSDGNWDSTYGQSDVDVDEFSDMSSQEQSMDDWMEEDRRHLQNAKSRGFSGRGQGGNHGNYFDEDYSEESSFEDPELAEPLEALAPAPRSVFARAFSTFCATHGSKAGLRAALPDLDHSDLDYLIHQAETVGAQDAAAPGRRATAQPLGADSMLEGMDA